MAKVQAAGREHFIFDSPMIAALHWAAELMLVSAY